MAESNEGLITIDGGLVSLVPAERQSEDSTTEQYRCYDAEGRLLYVGVSLAVGATD